MGKDLKVLWSFDYMDEDTVCSHVDVLSNMSFRVQNYTDDIFKTAFGKISDRGINTLWDFFEDRCCPPTRVKIKEDVLDKLGLESYDPIAIARYSHGVLTDDHQWIKFNSDDPNLCWDDVIRPLRESVIVIE